MVNMFDKFLSVLGLQRKKAVEVFPSTVKLSGKPVIVNHPNHSQTVTLYLPVPPKALFVIKNVE